MKKVLLITDNEALLSRYQELVKQKGLDQSEDYAFQYAFSFRNKAMKEKYAGQDWIRPVNVKTETEELVSAYDLIFSLHCKQLFPAALVSGVRCVNVHPGLNPHNRGWFPQVFSIINGKPSGATIHEIDEDLDHGGIIAQKEVKIESWDTSLTAYNKILDAELELLDTHLEAILAGTYETTSPEEGNLNLKKDFDALCQIDMEETGTFREHIDRLRALTHGQYENAYFIDEEGNKIYLKLELRREE